MVECTPIKVLAVTLLLAHDPFSSLAYPMITLRPPVASNMPTKTLVARQRPTIYYTHVLIVKTAQNYMYVLKS